MFLNRPRTAASSWPGTQVPPLAPRAATRKPTAVAADAPLWDADDERGAPTRAPSPRALTEPLTTAAQDPGAAHLWQPRTSRSARPPRLSARSFLTTTTPRTRSCGTRARVAFATTSAALFFTHRHPCPSHYLSFTGLQSNSSFHASLRSLLWNGTLKFQKKFYPLFGKFYPAKFYLQRRTFPTPDPSGASQPC